MTKIPLLALVLALAACRTTSNPAAPDDLGTVHVSIYTEGDSTWADVYVDGHFVGNGDMHLPLSPGDHVVRVELEGFEPFERRIHVLPNIQTQDLNVQLDEHGG